MLVDYHVHTILSGDSEQTINSVCEDAINLGIKEICITEHQDFYPKSFYYNRYDYNKVCELIDFAKIKFPQITVKLGIELDYQTQYLSEIFDICSDLNFDYILGSVHKINNIGVENQSFYKDLSMDEAYIIYFNSVREMICTNMFNSVAHFDFIKRGAISYYGEFKPSKYKNEICDTLKEIIKRDMSLEINTNGYHWKELNDFYPSVEILKWYKDLGGENIIYGSDSHKVHHLGTKINDIYQLMKSLGFNYITTYTNRIKKLVPIE